MPSDGAEIVRDSAPREGHETTRDGPKIITWDRGHHESGPTVDTTRPLESGAPVTGGWGAWALQTPCSGSCGEASQTWLRRCDSPPPQNGGATCVGPSQRKEICLAPPCSSGCKKTATFDDIWQGRAHLELYHKLTPANTGWPTDYGGGVQIKIVKGVWYLLSRKNFKASQCVSACGSSHLCMGMEIRASHDSGLTWSAPTAIVSPKAGKAWECAATDGDLTFDTKTQRWSFLFQCFGRDGKWQGCLARRSGTSPLGAFTDAGIANPVVKPKQLWGPICDAPQDDCVRLPGGSKRVFDEGTFHIIERRGGAYFVGFHGVDPLGQGYTGIAKTSDFISWTAGKPSAGVPSDAIFDRDDARSWHENWAPSGPVGGGSAAMIHDGSHYYMLVESPDISLYCTQGQNWDFGLLRASSLTQTTWDQLPAGNPLFFSSKIKEAAGGTTTLPCNLQYAGMFVDSSTGYRYINITRVTYDSKTFGIYIYRLVPDFNLLKDGDIHSCSTASWKRIPSSGPTNLVAYRLPNRSLDGTCYLASNCGRSPCAGGESFYQDLNATPLRGQDLTFGGSFRSDDASPGSLSVIIHQLSASYAILETTKIPVSLSAAFKRVKKNVKVLNNTAILRYQVYLATGPTIRADQLFVKPAGACPSP